MKKWQGELIHMNIEKIDFNNYKNGEIRYLKGEGTAYISHHLQYVELPLLIDMENALYIEGDYIGEITFQSGKLVYPSLTAAYDLFYYEDGTNFEISVDYYELMRKYMDSLHEDEFEKNYFLQKGYFSAGRTIYKELHRVPNGCGLLKDSAGRYSLIRLPIRQFEVDQEVYLRGLLETISLKKPGTNDYIAFSGGLDSSLIALILFYEFKINPNLVLVNMKDVGWDENYEKRAAYYKNKLNANLALINSNYDFSFSDISYLTQLMPLAAHVTGAFYSTSSYINAKGGRCWTGQNSDALYALGKTGDGIGPKLGKYLISDLYIKKLNDVNDKSKISMSDYWKCTLYSLWKKRRYRLPKTVAQLREALRDSATGMPLLETYSSNSAKCRYDFNEAKRLLFEDRISSHLNGGDHRILQYAGRPQRETVFVFSSVLMTIIQINKPIAGKELKHNKLYIENLIQGYIGTDDYRKLYPYKLYHSGNTEKRYYANILKETKFGKSLIEFTGYDGQSVQTAVSLAWQKQVKINAKSKY